MRRVAYTLVLPTPEPSLWDTTRKWTHRKDRCPDSVPPRFRDGGRSVVHTDFLNKYSWVPYKFLYI